LSHFPVLKTLGKRSQRTERKYLVAVLQFDLQKINHAVMVELDEAEVFAEEIGIAAAEIGEIIEDKVEIIEDNVTTDAIGATANVTADAIGATANATAAIVAVTEEGVTIEIKEMTGTRKYNDRRNKKHQKPQRVGSQLLCLRICTISKKNFPPQQHACQLKHFLLELTKKERGFHNKGPQLACKLQSP